MKNWKNIIFYIIFIPLTTVSCGVKLGRDDRERKSLPTTAMQNFLYAYTEKNGFRSWEVKAAQAHTYEGDNIYLYNFTMTIFSDKNQIKSVLVANKGRVQQNIGNLVAEGEVRIFASNQSILQTEKIYWDQNRELFYSETNKLVTYIKGKNKVTGYDMISDSVLENIVLDNTVGQIDAENTPSNNSESVNNQLSDFENEFIFVEE